ncbi:MAG: TPR repeat-containing protein YrrB [bacterium ADurb.Bin363]|nr:MAG: TPR repeat-containing protein YrrB [bacterium ADurb.Bin363]
MNKDQHKKKLSTDEMLSILKQSRAKPLSLDDILTPKKALKQQEILSIGNKHKPVIIPILDEELDISSPEKEKSQIQMMLMETMGREISPSPGAIKPGKRIIMVEEQIELKGREISPSPKEEKPKAAIIKKEKIKPPVMEVEKPLIEKKHRPIVFKEELQDLKLTNNEVYEDILEDESHKNDEITNFEDKKDFFFQDAGKKSTSEENSNREILPDKEKLKESYFHYNLGIKLTRSGEYRLAIDEYKKATEINPNFLEAYNNMANLSEITGEKQKALEYYTKGLNIDDSNASLHQNIALLLCELNNLKEALKHIKKAKELEPQNIYILSDMGVILLEDNKLYEATECFYEALDMEPDNPILNYNLACIFQKQGEKKEALDRYKKVLDLDPYNYYSYFNLAKIYIESKKLTEAIRCLKKAMDINPYDSDIYCELGGLYYQEKKYETAYYYYSTASKLSPDNPGIKYNLALTLANQKKLKEYTEELDKAYKMAIKCKDQYVLHLIENAIQNFT